ncbi:MAG TPA: hypothetical protein VF603_05340 [Allosphingosinicella sp.]|jgi:hypothetical protein
MNREDLLGPAVSPETGEAYEPGTGYKGVGIGAGIVVLIAMKTCHSLVTGGVGSDRPASVDLPRQIAAGVAEARTHLPVRLDDVTTMTGITAAGTTIIYDMRLETDIATADIPAARADQQRYIDSAACETPDTRRMIDGGATLAYRYTDPSGDRFQTQIGSCAGAPSAPAARVPDR